MGKIYSMAAFRNLQRIDLRPVIKSDLKEIVEWYNDRKLVSKQINLDWFSDTGFIVPGIAAGFVYFSSNSKRAYIEDFITNPKSSKDDRNNALDLIANQIESICRQHKVKYIVATTNVKAIIVRAINHGYLTDNKTFHMLYKEI